MSGNNGWVGSNNPSFLKSTSSASRIIRRLTNGAPPQYAASYSAKYRLQLGNDTFCWKAGTPPQFSKMTLRLVYSFVSSSIVFMLGRPFGAGRGSGGKSISFARPETSIVASVTG